MSKSRNKLKLYLCILIFITGIIGISIFLKSSCSSIPMTSPEALKKYIEGYGEKSYMVFFIIQFMSVIIAPIPSNVSAAVGGMVFGTWKAFIISLLAISSGSMVVFILGRKLGRAFTNRFISPKIISKYEEYFSSRSGEIILILLLLLPFFPDDAIGFAAGLSSISLKRYFYMMLLTRPWEILAASALGSTKLPIPLWGWVIILLLFIYIVKNCDKIEKKLVSVIKVR